MDALTPSDATEIILNNLTFLSKESVSFREASGRVLRQQIKADRDFPAFDRVMMDGIAINYSDFENGINEYKSTGIQRAGIPALALESGCCLEVMTGSVVPLGADCVIPIEQVSEKDGVFTLEESIELKSRQFIHQQGSDNHSGDVLIESGTLINGKEMAVIASCGYAEVEVTIVPSIVIVSTGDELVEVDQTPGPFQIRKSNSYALASACESLGFPVKVRLEHLPDDADIIRNKLGEIIEGADVVLFSGGISKGKYDFIPGALVELGVEKRFQWIRQRPGKPMWFGTAKNGSPVFALPGNPNSTLTCFYRYAVPGLKLMAGLSNENSTQVVLAEPFNTNPKLALFVSVVLENRDGTNQVQSCKVQNSGDLTALSNSHGFIELPASEKSLPVGSLVNFYPW